MLYVYCGADADTARKKVQATIGKMLAKNPDALYFRVTPDVLKEYDFDELTGSQTLFKREYVVVLDSLFGSDEGQEIVLTNIQKIADAPHPFFVLDGQIAAPIRSKLEKYAQKIYEFSTPVNTKANTFNLFSLADALGEKNVRRLWILFREAKQRGYSDEEIHGILFWMLKSLALAAQTTTPEDAGMKPYPYNKTKRLLKNFRSQEYLEALLTKFALLPQHARRHGSPLEIELEIFILSLE
ncbi:hypothetical protein CL652_00500 [bacterium]|nr:hypothetical protein [bacterium]|tara:strand:- start:16831 stop:17553 length:723 start_codon:yes stop_codon:yes gene_type:complete